MTVREFLELGIKISGGAGYCYFLDEECIFEITEEEALDRKIKRVFPWDNAIYFEVEE